MRKLNLFAIKSDEAWAIVSDYDKWQQKHQMRKEYSIESLALMNVFHELMFIKQGVLQRNTTR